MPVGPDEVLRFWFEETPPDRRFRADPKFDAEIARRFGDAVEAAGRGELDHWQETPEGALALVVLLDQFPRNIHRGSPRAFAFDAKAREVARRAIAAGFDRKLPRGRRAFFYLPFEHSEDLTDQVRAVHLFATLGDEGLLDWAFRHWRIVARFGRFPHRNAVLGRTSTPEEERFLATPGSGF